MTTMQAAIEDQIYLAMKKLGAPPTLRGVIGSWGDTLTEEQVWTMLNDWNQAQKSRGT